MLAGLLSRRSHSVGVLCDRAPEVGAETHHFPLTVPVSSRFAEEMRFAINEFRPDVVHLLACGVGKLGMAKTVIGRIPWILTVHNLPPFERRLDWCFRNKSVHYLIRNARFLPNTLAWRRVFRRGLVPRVVVHSAEVGRRVVEYGQPPGGVEEIPLGLVIPPRTRGVNRAGEATRRSGFDLASTTVQSVSVAGLAFTKGHHDAIEAVARCRKEGLDLRHRVIGRVKQPAYYRYLQRLVRYHGLERSVAFELDAQEPRKRQVLAEADIYIQPSHEEGFCLAFVEALAEVPRLVGTATGVMTLFDHGDPCIRIVRPGEPQQLARAISELVGAPTPSGFMDRRRERLADLLSQESYVRRHEALYEALIASCQRASRA